MSTRGIDNDISSVLKLLGDSAVRVIHVDIQRDEDGDGRLFGITVDHRQHAELHALMLGLTSLVGVERVEIDEGRI